MKEDENLVSLSIQWINERNKALTKAGEGIVAARKSLDQLEEILSGTVECSWRRASGRHDAQASGRDQSDPDRPG
mgnify:CR=1 FL=1